MKKSVRLWIRIISLLLVLLVCGTALAGTATPTDIDDPTPTDPQDPNPTDPQDPQPTDPQNPDPTGTKPSETTPPPDWVIKGDVLVACNSTAAKLTVPKGVKVIGPKAFLGLKKLKVVTLPDSVEKIDKEAFSGCVKLEKVKLTKKSKLKEICAHAFKNCKVLDTSFVPKGVKVAKNAFEGAGKKPAKTPKPTLKPTPKPTPTPAPKPRMGGGGGGGSSEPRIPHSKWTETVGPDYDLLNLNQLEEDAGETMEQLTLGGETLALALNPEGDEKAGDGFTVTGMDWEKESREIDTLVLTAAEGKDRNVWSLNGEVLRRMNKSGIRHLVLRSGSRIAVLETEGFLAGWNYDELKSRGTANRRFEYAVEMDADQPAKWQVSIEGALYELTTDEHAGIYMTGVYSGSAEALEKPYNTLFAKE